jgi:hypothetical protein
MRAVLFNGIGDIRLENVPSPELKLPTDAVVRITTSAICGTTFISCEVPSLEGCQGPSLAMKRLASLRKSVRQ